MKLGIRGQGLAVSVGVVLVIAGTIALIRPLLDVSQRNAADSLALQAWRAGGSVNLQGALAGPPTHFNSGGDAATCSAGNTAPDAYALVQFPTLASYGYAGVAINGDWNGLLKRSMVHWQGSAAPGQSGNAIIAFHREPDFEHIDRLTTDDIVTIQDHSCHTYGYRVNSRSELEPKDVSQLVPTQGHDLTLITCTPWWIDNHRLVWRGTLVSKDGKPFSG